MKVGSGSVFSREFKLETIKPPELEMLEMTSTEPRTDSRESRQLGVEGAERQSAKRPLNPVLAS